jgi:hypothetical protein
VASSNEIEDLFASAVKSVFDPAAAPPAAASPPAQPAAAVEPPRPRRIRAWAVVLLCLALAVVTALIAVVVFHVRRSEITRMVARIQAEYPALAPGLQKLVSLSRLQDDAGSSNRKRNAVIEEPAAAKDEAAAMRPAVPDGSGLSAHPSEVVAAHNPAAPADDQPVDESQSPSASETPGELETAAAPWMIPGAADPRAAVPPKVQHSDPAAAAQAADRRPEAQAHPAGQAKTSEARPATLPSASAMTRAAPLRDGQRSMAARASANGHGGMAGKIASNSNVQAAAQSGTPGAGKSNSATAAGTGHALPLAQATPAVSAAASASAGSAAPSASSPGAIVVASPDHSVYWALEPYGAIFRSTDRKSWEQQKSGVRSDLLAGEAPTTKVCWAVGRHGTILLTTDGERWQRINSPIKTDIVSVSALSADVADIVAADGSRLSTFDRGSNWMPTN